jgi:hypothetical protein
VPAKQGADREDDHAGGDEYGCSHAVRIVAHEAVLSPTELYVRGGAEASGLDLPVLPEFVKAAPEKALFDKTWKLPDVEKVN